MVFRKSSKNGGDGRKLLNVTKKRSEDIPPNTNPGRSKFGKRLTSIFRKPATDKHRVLKPNVSDDNTPPPSPEHGDDVYDGFAGDDINEPVSVQVVTATATEYPRLYPTSSVTLSALPVAHRELHHFHHDDNHDDNDNNYHDYDDDNHTYNHHHDDNHNDHNHNHHENEEEDRSYSGTTISDLSASVKRSYVMKPSHQSPMKEIGEETSTAQYTELSPSVTIQTTTAAGTGTTTTTTTAGGNDDRTNMTNARTTTTTDDDAARFSCTPDNLVNNLFGLVSEETCFALNPCGPAIVEEENDTRDARSHTTRGTGTSYPTWGTAPTDDHSDDDDGDTRYTYGTGAMYSAMGTEGTTTVGTSALYSMDDQQENATVSTRFTMDDVTAANTKAANNSKQGDDDAAVEKELREDQAAAPPPSPDRSHENFELILDPAALTSTNNSQSAAAAAPPPAKRKTLNWMRNNNNKPALLDNETNEQQHTANKVTAAAAAAVSNMRNNKSFKATATEASGKSKATNESTANKIAPFVKRLGKNSSKKGSAVPVPKPATKQTSGASQLTDELLGEGELLGEEILEENEGSVLSATYTEMAATGTIVGIEKIPSTNNNNNRQDQLGGEEEALEMTAAKALQKKKQDDVATNNKALLENVTDEAATVTTEGRARSWNVLTRALAKRRSKTDQKKEVSRTHSSPMRISYDANKNAIPSTWKAAEDPNTGRMYYYHKLTRKTTWTKPPNYDEMAKKEQELRKSVRPESATASQFLDHSMTRVPSDIVIASSSDLSGEQQMRLDAGEDIVSSVKAVEPILKGSRGIDDSDRTMSSKKEEIATLLVKMAPPDDSSVVKLMDQYEGREDELLVQLRDLSKTTQLNQPFDEPVVKTSTSFASDISDPDISAAKSLSKARTSNTSSTGVSALTEQTERIKNTATPGYVFEAIKESEEIFDDESISSNTMSEPASPESVESDLEVEVGGKRNPKARPVVSERTRDLLVEEFNYSRLNVENYDKQATTTAKSARQRKMDAKRAMRAADPKITAPPSVPHHHTRNPSATYSIGSEYSAGGGSDSDAGTFTDTVSALSDIEPEFHNRKANFDHARRKALDDAIRSRDWELAATVTENMRQRSMDSSEPSDQYEEWTQSELDKFISENDWDAVASYIAQMRDTGAAYAEKLSLRQPQEGTNGKFGPGDVDTNIQKRFGARSQLQHAEDELSVSSWESESFYESDDGSCSSSDVSFGDIHRMVRKEFAC